MAGETSRTEQKKVEARSANQFRSPRCDWHYRFPIPRVLHPKWGRIEINLEPVLERGVIRRLYLWFERHEIVELEGCFGIPTPQANKRTVLTTYTYGKETGSFFAGVWGVRPCLEHKGALIFRSSPSDGATGLVITTLTSSINVHYEIGGMKQ